MPLTLSERHYCIALANKVVRTAWTMLRNETKYSPILITA